MSRVLAVLAIVSACTPSERTTLQQRERSEPAMSSTAAGPQVAPPRVLAVRARAARPEYLVVFLHGVGATADDLLPIAQSWGGALPGAESLLPDGLYPFDGGGSGRQWFSLRGLTDASRPALVRQAATQVSAWLDQQLAARGLPRERVVLAGFSQGAMLSEWLAVHREPAPLAVVAFSGRYADDEPPRPGRTPSPVLLVHGTADPMIPVAFASEARDELARRGASVRLVIEPGMGHTISEDGVNRGLAFVRERLEGR